MKKGRPPNIYQKKNVMGFKKAEMKLIYIIKKLSPFDFGRC